jgi:peptide/nickel transport system substrate-binding protein
MKKVVSLMAVLLIISSIVVACGATPEPQVIQTEKEVTRIVEGTPVVQTIIETQVVEKTVEVQKEVVKEVVVTATPEPTPAPKTGGTLIWAMYDELLGLDPHTNPLHRSLRLYELVYSTMTKLGRDLSVQPELAESWEISNDTVYTFHLRQGVKFHNGDELTSEDIKFTYERIMNPDIGSPVKTFLDVIQSIETPDKYTVVITLSEPNPAFLINIAHPNMSIVSEKVATEGDLAKDVVGTGPFKLAEWVPDNYMRLERNPDFFIEGLPYLDGIEWRVIPDYSTILAGLRTGEIDLADLPAKNAQLARSSGTLQVATSPILTYSFLAFNCEREPFTDPRVRLALSYAVDRQAVIDTVLLGEGQITGPLPPSLQQWALPLTEYPNYTRDLDKAKALLAEAGYPDGFEFPVMVLGDEAVARTQVLQDQLKDIGVQIQIESVERGLYIENWKNSNFDAFCGGNSGSPSPDYMLNRTFHTGGATNVFKYSNPTVDELLDKGQVTVDYDTAKGYYDELQRVLVEDAPMVWLYVANQFRVYQSYVQDVTVMPDTSIVYAREIWLDK